jgi:hypothetical protein
VHILPEEESNHGIHILLETDLFCAVEFLDELDDYFVGFAVILCDHYLAQAFCAQLFVEQIEFLFELFDFVLGEVGRGEAFDGPIGIGLFLSHGYNNRV